MYGFFGKGEQFRYPHFVHIQVFISCQLCYIRYKYADNVRSLTEYQSNIHYMCDIYLSKQDCLCRMFLHSLCRNNPHYQYSFYQGHIHYIVHPRQPCWFLSWFLENPFFSFCCFNIHSPLSLTLWFFRYICQIPLMSFVPNYCCNHWFQRIPLNH